MMNRFYDLSDDYILEVVRKRWCRYIWADILRHKYRILLIQIGFINCDKDHLCMLKEWVSRLKLIQ